MELNEVQAQLVMKLVQQGLLGENEANVIRHLVNRELERLIVAGILKLP